MDSCGHVATSQELNEDQAIGFTRLFFFMCEGAKSEHSIFGCLDGT